MNLNIDNETLIVEKQKEQEIQLTEYEQTMINKAKANRGEEIEEIEDKIEYKKEELIADKFKTQEELIKAYKELESKLGIKPPKEKIIEDKKEIIKEGYKKEDEINDKIEVATLNDFNKYFEEFSKNNNTISEESYKELETKHKLPKEIVDAYIQGQKVVFEKAQQEAETEILDVIGGKENYNEIVNWAKSNLSEQEINEYNELLQVGDLKTSKLAVQNLFYKYKTNNTNNEPQVKKILSGNTIINNVESYKDQKEFYAAMSDKKYKNDKHYREEVLKKRKNSNF